MNHDRENSDAAAATRDEPTIELWRVPNRIWPGFPALVVVRVASWLGRGRNPAIGKGGVVSVFLDGSKVGTISPKQIKVFQVSPGEHSLSLHFLGGLRRSQRLHVALGEGEKKQFVCLLNTFGWPSIRPATADDVASIERPHSAPYGGSEPLA
jgi:hypothetical protein